MLRIIVLLIRGMFCIPYWVMTMAKWNKTGKGTEKERYDYLFPCIQWIVKHARVNMVVSGVEKLPEEGGYMIAPNHQGMFDAFMLLSTHKRPLTAVFKIEIKSTPIINHVAEFLKGYAMDRSNLRESIKVIRQVGEDIKKGRIVVIFPEGTRSKQGNIMGEFKGGSFKAAQNAKAPIVPVAMIDCFKPFDTKGLAWVDCQIHYLEPIYFEQYQDLSTQEIADLVKSRIQAKMDEVLKK